MDTDSTPMEYDLFPEVLKDDLIYSMEEQKMRVGDKEVNEFESFVRGFDWTERKSVSLDGPDKSKTP
eukprot:Nk52_evm1s447 gene=Nk52_evmTU1s447